MFLIGIILDNYPILIAIWNWKNTLIINNAKYSIDFETVITQKRNKTGQISASEVNLPMSSVIKKM